MKKTVVAAILAAILAGPAGEAANASSIAYVKDDNVWVASPDGSNQHQVTTDGEPGWRYGSPSQADDGTIVAARGDEIVRLRQNGQVLSKFDPPATTDSAGQHIDGIPVDVAVSPDGTKVAYTFIQANCPVGVSCGVRYVTMYSHSDRATDPEEFGKLYRRNPSWVTNDRTLVFNGYQHQVNLDDFGGGRDSDVHWFDDEDVFGQDSSTDLGDGELSPQGDRLAILRGYGDNVQLGFYAVSGDVKSGAPPAAPAPACTTGAEPTLNSPTWSPDGRTIAFEHKEGIETIALPNVAPDDCSGASSGTVVIPGGKEPDFGPADVNPETTVDPQPRGELVVGKQKAVKRSTAAKKGIAIKVTVPGAGRLSATLRNGKSKLATGTTTTPGAGPATLTIRLSKKAAARLRTAKSLTVALRYEPVESGALLEKSLSLKVTK